MNMMYAATFVMVVAWACLSGHGGLGLLLGGHCMMCQLGDLTLMSQKR